MTLLKRIIMLDDRISMSDEFLIRRNGYSLRLPLGCLLYEPRWRHLLDSEVKRFEWDSPSNTFQIELYPA